MDRRKFLMGAVAAAALPAVAPLVPAAANVATAAPPATGVIASRNVLLSADVVAAEALRILRAPNPFYAHLMDDEE